jgi:hypothetical protein
VGDDQGAQRRATSGGDLSVAQAVQRGSERAGGEGLAGGEDYCGHERYRQFVQLVAERTLGVRIADWRWVDCPNAFRMCCGPLSGQAISYHVNVPTLGVAWFERAPMQHPDMVDLTIHELGHFDGCGHLTDGYYDNLTGNGGRLVVEVMKARREFEQFA